MMAIARFAVDQRCRYAAVTDRIFNILEVGMSFTTWRGFKTACFRSCYSYLLSIRESEEPDAPAIDGKSVKTKADVSRPEVALHQTSEFWLE